MSRVSLACPHYAISKAERYKDTIFRKTASFNGCRVEGSAYFSGACFEYADEQVDFTSAWFGKTFELDESTFKGSASFVSMTCGSHGVFTNAKFDSKEAVNFTSAVIGGFLIFDGAEFEGYTAFDLLKCGGKGGFNGVRFKSEQGASFVRASFEHNLEVTNTTFEGPAIFNSTKCGLAGFFSYTTFKSEAEFGYATFEGHLDCSDVSFEEQASFVSARCADLACNDAKFEGPVRFNHLRCSHSGHFRRTQFRGPEQVSFGYASFDDTLDCSDAVFEGPVQFGSLRCAGTSFFQRTQFLNDGEVDFVGASFSSNIMFQESRFEGAAVFNSCRVEGAAFFNNVHFEAASFGHALVEKDLYLDWATIEGEAEFGWLECRNLVCRGTTFNEETTFNSLRCNVGAQFSGASFRKEVTFPYAHFAEAWDCTRAKFQGGANFGSAACGGTAFFNGVEFSGSQAVVNWSNASFSGDLELLGTIFCGPVDFSNLACEGSGRYARTHFLNPSRVSFTNAVFAGNLQFEGAIVFGPLDLSMIQVSQELAFNSVQFAREVSLHRATIGTLRLEGEGFPTGGNVSDLRGLRFSGFSGSEAKGLALVESQNPAAFTREPYLQLERYYSNVGNEVEAKKTHYRGRRDLRENAKSSSGVTRWPWWTKLGDLLWKWLSGYGARTWLLAVYIGIFLAAGVAVFWPDGAVAPRPLNPSNTGTAAATAEETTDPPSWQKPLAPIAYSLDLFIPVVNLRLENRWEPVGQLRGGYALVHTMAGWLLVPLLVASLTGIVRRQ